jgi:hypothetical protein
MISARNSLSARPSAKAARAPFVAVPSKRTRCVAVSVRASFTENLINSLTVALKNSPINEGKKALAMAQAGNYDQVAVKAKLDKYIADNAVSALQGKTHCVVFFSVCRAHRCM